MRRSDDNLAVRRKIVTRSAAALILLIGTIVMTRSAFRSDENSPAGRGYLGQDEIEHQLQNHAGKTGQDQGQENGNRPGKDTNIGPRGAPVHVNGAYRVIVSGFYSGEGTAAVGANSVNINVHVTSESGQRFHLRAPHLARNGIHFGGTGTLAGHTVDLTGRVEPADGTIIKRSRLSCHFESSDGHNGLIAGHRRGNE